VGAPLYELALLTASHLARRGLSEAELAVVTPERRPLEAFGPGASTTVEQALTKGGVAWYGEREPRAVEAGRLRVVGGDALPADRVVALPLLGGPRIPGLPQDGGGFLPTDEKGAVSGLEDVYAAGDGTNFPVKQGGLAAQQADAAAASIAHQAGADVAEGHFRPVLRGILLGAGLPRYLRADPAGGGGEVSEHALWWPGGAAGKVAGRHLAPYLRRWGGHEPGEPLTDFEPDDPLHAEADRTALDFALTAADADAQWGEYGSALAWLDAAQDIGIVLPPEYADKRREWRRLARP